MNDALATQAALHRFRTDLFACFDRRADALVELTDAALTAGPASSLAHLSLEAVHRRGWGSLYDALRDGQIDLGRLRSLLDRHPLDAEHPVYAVDLSVWPRCDAATSPERALYYHPSRHVGGIPAVPGWAFQWVVQLGLTRDSWTAPLDVQRLAPDQKPTALALQQVRAVRRRLPADVVVPTFVFDAGYDPTTLAHELADEPVALLIRLRGDRIFFTDPVPLGRPRTKQDGRPRRNGPPFVCTDPATWPEPTAEYACEDPQYGQVAVRAWARLHTVVRRAGAGTYRPRPLVYGWVLRVEVERLPGEGHDPKVLWLWWQGPGEPNLSWLWRAYCRRFDIEQMLRFFKQTLNWVMPRVRLPEQADQWTWLLVAAYTQLRLARGCVADERLPWERPLAPALLTPGRVRRSFVTLVVRLGTPAAPPKPCGRSPGRPIGRRSGRAPRFPRVKKAA